MGKKLKQTNISDEFIIRFLNGELKSEEMRELENWIGSSSANAEQFELYRRIWLGTSASLHSDNFNGESAWAKVHNQIRSKGSANGLTDGLRNRKLFRRILQIAAMVILFVSAGAAGAWYIFSGQEIPPSDEYCEIVAPKGSKSQIKLPDGSTAWINAGSRLSYRGDFNRSDRVVNLEGEGYFNVISNKSSPFIVQTPYLKVKAFGTVFNVKAYPEEQTVEATLVEGIVEIEAGDRAKSDETHTYTLKPKQNIIYHIESGIAEQKSENTDIKEPVGIKTEAVVKNDVKVISNIKPELYTSWKDENWVIEGMPLDELAVLMGRRFNCRIEIKDDALRLYKFSGTIQNETLEQVMVILSLTTPLEYEIGKGNVNWILDKNLERKYSRILKR